MALREQACFRCLTKGELSCTKEQQEESRRRIQNVHADADKLWCVFVEMLRADVPRARPRVLPLTVRSCVAARVSERQRLPPPLTVVLLSVAAGLLPPAPPSAAPLVGPPAL